MPASLVDLNEDVLLILVSFLDPSSARQLSQTARAVHVISKYRALESITLTSFEKTARFCKYMLEDMPHRLPALRELRLHTKLPEALPDVLFHYIRGGLEGTARIHREARLLTAMLTKTPNLRVLALHSAEYWIAHASALADVLASLRHLQEIELENAGEMTEKFIKFTRASPRRLAFLNEQWYPDHQDRFPLFPSQRFRLPSVEYLVAYDPVHQSGEIKGFAWSFPNVKRLDILRVPKFTREGPRVWVNWPSLERVRGGVFSFDWTNVNGVHLLQLINRLSTTLINAHPTTQRLSEESVGPVACTSASPAISSVQPVALIMHMDVTAEGQLLGPIVESSARLRYLAVLLDDARRPNDVAPWWASFCQGLIGTKIICLEVRLPDTRIQRSGQALASPNSEEGMRYKRAVVRMVAKSAWLLPHTLRYLSLDLRPREESRWRYDFLAPEEEQEIWTPPDLHWWSVESEGGTRRTSPLDAEKGERIAAYLRSVKYDYTRHLNVEQDIPAL